MLGNSLKPSSDKHAGANQSKVEMRRMEKWVLLCMN
jgi:hypothetical protein